MNYHLNVDLHNPVMNKILVKNYPQKYAQQTLHMTSRQVNYVLRYACKRLKESYLLHHEQMCNCFRNLKMLARGERPRI